MVLNLDAEIKVFEIVLRLSGYFVCCEAKTCNFPTGKPTLPNDDFLAPRYYQLRHNCLGDKLPNITIPYHLREGQ